MFHPGAALGSLGALGMALEVALEVALVAQSALSEVEATARGHVSSPSSVELEVAQSALSEGNKKMSASRPNLF